jgi:hypothetical protein
MMYKNRLGAIKHGKETGMKVWKVSCLQFFQNINCKTVNMMQMMITYFCFLCCHL